jgi:hypothetical protein
MTVVGGLSQRGRKGHRKTSDSASLLWILGAMQEQKGGCVVWLAQLEIERRKCGETQTPGVT